MSVRFEMKRVGGAVFGFAALFAAWQAVAASGVAGSSVPSPAAVLVDLSVPDHSALFARATAATLSSAAGGYVIAAVLGIGLAALGKAGPVAERAVGRLNAWVHAIPMIALGPVFVILLGVDRAPTAMAAIAAVFAFFVAASSGMVLASAGHRDLLAVLGARTISRVQYLDLPVAMPVIATGAKLAVPRALMGAILGEWFGANRGLGVLMANAMQDAQINLLWSAVLLTNVAALVGYGLAALVEGAAWRRFA